MAKLQLYISKSLRGFKSLVNINPEEEVRRHIYDYRSALDTIEYDNSREHIFYLLNYLEEGLLLTVLCTIPGETAGNYMAGSIFFPSGVLINADDTTSLCRAVAKALSAAAGNDFSQEAVAEMRELFNDDYAVDTVAKCLTSGKKNYAYAYFGTNAPAFDEYARAKFYQPAFSEYAGVILIDRSEGAFGKDESKDLTRKQIVATTTLLPPENTREGFAPFIYNHPFTEPFLVPVDEEVEIQWRRGGFDTILQKITASAGKACTVPQPDTSASKKTITPSSFYITEQGTQRSVGSFLIKVNDVEIESSHTFDYSELVDARVEISSPGYFSFSGHLDLASTTQALVALRRLQMTYRFDLPLHTPEPAEAIRIYLKTKKPITQCPIEGYAVAGDKISEGAGKSNNLVYVGGQSRSNLYFMGIVAGVALLLGILIGALAFGGKSEKAPEAEALAEPVTEQVAAEAKATEAPTATPAAEATTTENAPADTAEAPAPEAAASDYTAAVAYLDANKVWRRAEMEEIAAIKGLFDDLNSYNFKRVLNEWAPALEKSKNFTQVARAVAGSATKRDPHTGAHKPLYNNNGDDDKAINWLSYTFWVDP